MRQKFLRELLLTNVSWNKEEVISTYFALGVELRYPTHCSCKAVRRWKRHLSLNGQLYLICPLCEKRVQLSATVYGSYKIAHLGLNKMR